MRLDVHYDLRDSVSLRLTSRALLLNDRHHLPQHFVNRHGRRIEHDRIRRRHQRRIGARTVPGVAFSHVGERFFESRGRIELALFSQASFGAPFRRRHPRSYGKRRFVANVLSVPARKVGNPIAVLAMVKASDLSQRHLRQAEREQRRARGYDHVLLPVDGVGHR